jgi:hypothetical protein
MIMNEFNKVRTFEGLNIEVSKLKSLALLCVLLIILAAVCNHNHIMNTFAFADCFKLFLGS